MSGWLITFILLTLLIINRRRARNRMKTYRLLLLWRELERLHVENRLDKESETELTIRIDVLLRELGVKTGCELWQEERDAAWKYLCNHIGISPWPDPPWQIQEPAREEETPEAHQSATTETDTPKTEDSAPVFPSGVPEYDTPPPLPSPEKTSATPPSLPKTATSPPISKTKNDEATRYAWEPARPGPLEQALKAVSGWPRIIAPFLVQNIGWFISGFLFVAGCVFLVTYTAGFSRSFIISVILFGYTLLLMGGAYKLLERRAELRTAGSVLITLGMLLIPLSISASVRLIDMGRPGLFTTAAGILMTLVNLSVFYWAAQLASGIMDRSLRGPHSKVFISLAAVQIAAPLIARVSKWHLPALLHLVLLGLLGYGLIRFIRDWLKSIFIERQKLAYYAGGTLIYAALVSFVHLTWQYENPLPTGYSGPFLMILSGFLFYVDAQVKTWTSQYAFLSRFSFAVYGLSIMALTIAFRAPAARLITLALGAGVYGTVFRHYLTLPPLYLLLACLCGLYHQIILKYFPWDIYFLASLPGLAALFAIYRQSLRHKAEKLGQLCFQSLVTLTLALAGWSLFHAEPGWTGAGTGLTLTSLIYIILHHTPHPKTASSRPSIFYAAPLSGAITLAYCPILDGFRWDEQFPFSLILLALWLTGTGLRLHRRPVETAAYKAETLLNSALLSIITALAVYLICEPSDLMQSVLFHLILSLSAGVFLWQSLSLKVRGHFYIALILGGAAGASIKHAYFPYPPTGRLELLIVLIIWTLIWRLERIEKWKKESGLEQISSIKHQTSNIKATVRVPLKQLMVALWGLGLCHFLMYLPESDATVEWASVTGLIMLATILLTAYFRLLNLWWAVLILGLVAFLAPFYQPDALNLPLLGFIAVLYPILIWMILRWVVNQSFAARLAEFLLLTGGHGYARKQVEQQTCQTAYLMTLSGLAAVIWHWLNLPDLTVLPTLTVGMGFLCLSGRYYKNRCHSCAVLTILVVISLVIHARMLGIAETRLLPDDPRTGLLFALLSLGFWGMAWLSDRKVFRDEKSPLNFVRNLYRRLMLQTTPILAIMGAGQQIILIWTDSARNFGAMTVLAMGASSFGILLANHELRNRFLSLTGILTATLTVLCLYIFSFHNGEAFSLWPSRMSEDMWLMLSFLSLGLACLSHLTIRHPRWKQLYAQPLWCIASLGYCWSLLKIVPLFAEATFGNIADHYGTWLFLISGVTLFPLLKPVHRADIWRGAGILLMLTGVVVSLVPMTGSPNGSGTLRLLWGYVLWGFANGVLPRFNARFSEWAVSPGAWPWAGLLMVALSLPLAMGDSDIFLQWSYWLPLSLYLFLLLQNSGWSALPWIATGVLTLSGIVFVKELTGESHPYDPAEFIIGTLIWANLMLFVVPLWHRYGPALTARLGWRNHDLAGPFLLWPFIIMGIWLTLLFLTNLSVIFLNPFFTWKSIVVIAVVLAVSCLHLFLESPTSLNAHTLLLSLFNILLSWINLNSEVSHLPIALALWSLFLFAITSIKYPISNIQHQTSSIKHPISNIKHPASNWLIFTPWLVIPALLFAPVASLGESLLTLALLTGIFAGLSRRRRSPALLWTARLLGIIFLHTWPLLWIPSDKTQGLVLWHIWPLLKAQFFRLQILFPWYSLQLVLVVCILVGIRRRLAEGSFFYRKFFRNFVFEISIALGELTLHLLVFVNHLSIYDTPPGNAWIHAMAALATAVLLIGMGISQFYRSQQAGWIYGTAILTSAAGVYLRLLWAGLTRLNGWDTVAILGTAYALYMLQRFASSEILSAALSRVVLVTPLLAMITAPFQASAHTCATLLASGALYLSLRHTSGSSAALYMGTFTINAAIYLWIPSWANQYDLIQLYVIPAALSVLILLHLHQKELRRGMLNGMRLTAVSALYACATLDFFLRPDLSCFALALALSLIGIAAGIALRIRAFLYGGIIFMVLNVTGQLFLFYSQQTLGKGILLMALGSVFLAGMIWFNIRRETILKQIRIFRSDLEEWE